MIRELLLAAIAAHPGPPSDQAYLTATLVLGALAVLILCISLRASRG